MLQIEEVRDIRLVHSKRDAWRALVGRLPQADFFHTYEYLASWLDCFWNGRPVVFLFLYRGDELVGIAPFLEDREGAKGCESSLVYPVRVPEGCCPSALPADRYFDAVLGYLTATKRARRVMFAHVESTPGLMAQLTTSARRQGLWVARHQRPTGHRVCIEQNWTTFLSTRSRHWQHELQRKIRKAHRAAHLSCATATRPDDCADAIAAINSVLRNSWKAGSEVLPANSSWPAFLRLVAERCADRGWLRIHVLSANSEPAAYVFGVVFGNQYIALDTAYNEHFSALSPGALVFEHALRDAFDLGLSAFDFLSPDSRWKQDWANESRESVTACLFAGHHLRCAWCGMFRAGLKPFARRRLPAITRLGSFVTPGNRKGSHGEP